MASWIPLLLLSLLRIKALLLWACCLVFKEGLKAQQYSYILHGLGAVATSGASTILDCMEISGRLCLLLLVLLDFWGCEPDAAAFQGSDAPPSAASLAGSL